MTSIKTKLARKAGATTARHSAKGTISKLRRDPARSSTLLAIGAFAGFIAGRLVGRSPSHAN
jgi:hypothetical protein